MAKKIQSNGRGTEWDQNPREGEYWVKTSYNGAVSRRTRRFANKGNNRGAGAAVYNRMQALLDRYGRNFDNTEANSRNIARILRASANIMARATVAY